jgi:hypothetical protein
MMFFEDDSAVFIAQWCDGEEGAVEVGEDVYCLGGGG